MSYTYEKVSGNKAKLTFTVPAEQFDEALQKAFLKVRGRINVPGFRKGKAPRRMIETLYGESVFYDEALDAIFPDVYREAVKELDLHPVDQPEVEMDEIGAGKDLKFHLEVFVRPDVTLGDYKGLEVEVAQQKVTDEMIDARIAQDQEKVSRTVDVEDRPVQNGDTVNLNYAGTVDGVAFDGGTAENQTLTIGSNQFIPGFEEQMIGMNIGEEKDLNVTFPAQYHAENLAGKDAVFHVKVNSIQATEKPALDDDFAADVSEFNTFEEYRGNIVKELTKQVEESNANAIENAVMEKAVANAQMDVPAAMIDDQVDYMIQDMEMNMRYQGLKMEDFLKYTGQTLDAMKQSYRGEAERRVRTELVMEAIRKAEGAEPTEEEIEEEIKRQAESMGRDVEDFKKSLTDSQKDYLKDNAEIRKALKTMRESAKVSEPKPAEEPKAEETEAPKEEPKKPARRRSTKKTEKPADEAEA